MPDSKNAHNAQLKWRKSMGNIPITCPICKDNVVLSDTPLLSIFQEQLKAGMFHEKFDTIDAVNKRFLTFLEYYSQAAHEENCHQYKLWACHTCLQNKKAIVADFSKQKQAFGGPYIMYVDMTINCKYCSTIFNFSAREQQYYYEELNLSIESKATRCAACRKVKLVQQRLMELLPKNPEFTRLEMEELIECYEIMGSKVKAQEYRGRLKRKNA